MKDVGMVHATVAETIDTLVVIIPQYMHNEPECFAANEKIIDKLG